MLWLIRTFSCMPDPSFMKFPIHLSLNVLFNYWWSYLGVVKWTFSNPVIISAFMSWDSFIWMTFPSSFIQLSCNIVRKGKSEYVLQTCLYLSIVRIMNWGSSNFCWWSPVSCSILFWGCRWKDILSTHYKPMDFYRFDVFESVAVILFDIQIVPSLDLGGLYVLVALPC